jgi:hypothetical protein
VIRVVAVTVAGLPGKHFDPEIVKKKRDNQLVNTSEAGLPVFREAVPAIDGPSLSWLERYFAFLSAV